MMTDEILDVKIVKLDICRYISIVVFIVFFMYYNSICTASI